MTTRRDILKSIATGAALLPAASEAAFGVQAVFFSKQLIHGEKEFEE